MAGLYRDGKTHDRDKFGKIAEHCVTSAGNVENERFRSAFWHTRLTGIRWYQRGRKCGLKYALWLECFPKIFDLVGGWHEAHPCAVRAVLLSPHSWSLWASTEPPAPWGREPIGKKTSSFGVLHTSSLIRLQRLRRAKGKTSLHCGLVPVGRAAFDCREIFPLVR